MSGGLLRLRMVWWSMTGVRLLLTLNSTGDGRGRLGDQFTTASVLQSAWILNGLNKNQIDLTASTRARLQARGHSPCSRGVSGERD